MPRELLQVSEQYRITSDDHNYCLERRTRPGMVMGKMQPGGKWSPLGYYRDLTLLLQRIMNEQIRSYDGLSLEELLTKLTELKTEIQRIGECCKNKWEV